MRSLCQIGDIGFGPSEAKMRFGVDLIRGVSATTIALIMPKCPLAASGHAFAAVIPHGACCYVGSRTTEFGNWRQCRLAMHSARRVSKVRIMRSSLDLARMRHTPQLFPMTALMGDGMPWTERRALEHCTGNPLGSRKARPPLDPSIHPRFFLSPPTLRLWRGHDGFALYPVVS